MINLKYQTTRIIDHIYRFVFGLPLKKFSLITPNIYLGGQHNIRALKMLKNLGVTGIVNMRTSQQHVQQIKKNYKYLNLKTVDRTAPKLDDLIEGAKFMEDIINKGNKVYVHCRWGEGRGPSMVIAYLIYKGDKLEDAIQKVKGIRSFINLNEAQYQSLLDFQNLIARKSFEK